MNLIEKFLNGECYLNIKTSSKESIEELSHIIMQEYPDAGTGIVDDWDYPTIMSYYEDYADEEVCFYRTDQKIFDGYTHKESCPIKVGYTAEEMLERKEIKVSNEAEVMKMFS